MIRYDVFKKAGKALFCLIVTIFVLSAAGRKYTIPTVRKSASAECNLNQPHKCGFHTAVRSLPFSRRSGDPAMFSEAQQKSYTSIRRIAVRTFIPIPVSNIGIYITQARLQARIYYHASNTGNAITLNLRI